MVQRCENKRKNNYHRYGGRGIQVCKRWRKDFWAFIADMSPSPSPAHTLARIDNDKGYESGNVCWATPVQQACDPIITSLWQIPNHCGLGGRKRHRMVNNQLSLKPWMARRRRCDHTASREKIKCKSTSQKPWTPMTGVAIRHFVRI
jgi:hypothetical protein